MVTLTRTQQPDLLASSRLDRPLNSKSASPSPTRQAPAARRVPIAFLNRLFPRTGVVCSTISGETAGESMPLDLFPASGDRHRSASPPLRSIADAPDSRANRAARPTCRPRLSIGLRAPNPTRLSTCVSTTVVLTSWCPNNSGTARMSCPARSARCSCRHTAPPCRCAPFFARLHRRCRTSPSSRAS